MTREERNQLIARMRREGNSLQKIADVVGLSREGVRQILIDAGEHQPYGGGLSFRGKLVRDTPSLWEHGKRQAYNYGCRCDLCTEALRVYIASLKGKAPPSHGTSGYSNYGCRCDVCRAAHSEKMSSPRHKMIKERSKRRVYLRNLAQQAEQS